MAKNGGYGRKQKLSEEERLGVTLSKLKLQEYKRSQGLNCANNGKYEEAIEYLSMIDKDKPIVDQLREVLIRQVGNTRECPCCREAFIPNDSTSQGALELFKQLFGDKKEQNADK